MFERIRAILQTPLFGTKVIPRDATVPPEQFPEDEYPVNCPKCAYLLRGLPDGNCPECGQPFERGSLLVQQYVFGTWTEMLTFSGVRKWPRILMTAGFLAPMVGFFGGLFYLKFIRRELPTGATHPQILARFDLEARLVWIMFLIAAVGVLLGLIGCLIALVNYFNGPRMKRRAIKSAILRDSPPI